ncbi:uncharacterized protein SCHCODRAFT_02242022 [Schizophyllum commune H4-8]|uniref:uncharacterized protein n=1 Tax=Schizophyllum commune (strain H4-8 / FGSC 9210) TaxID=578458 RepID=UPI00215F5CD0|nr:uncharacterized protein SCHCODRAFT_02242022 [Schizophyllum commune H4-8]KAI5895889.1 hypothetical protein SCHCODRAFT_02242022 [Schizophyllum commune H4-8]
MVVAGTVGSGVGSGDEWSGVPPQGLVKSISLGDSTSVRPERDWERPGWQSLASCGPVKVRWMEDARMGEVAVALLSLVDLTGVLSVSVSASFARARRRLRVSSLLDVVSTGKILTDGRQRRLLHYSNTRSGCPVTREPRPPRARLTLREYITPSPSCITGSA